MLCILARRVWVHIAIIPKIYAKCGGDNEYNSSTHFCATNNKVYEKCNNNTYNPATHSCCNKNALYALSTQFCHSNVYDKCNNSNYDPMRLLMFSLSSLSLPFTKRILFATLQSSRAAMVAFTSFACLALAFIGGISEKGCNLAIQKQYRAASFHSDISIPWNTWKYTRLRSTRSIMFVMHSLETDSLSLGMEASLSQINCVCCDYVRQRFRYYHFDCNRHRINIICELYPPLLTAWGVFVFYFNAETSFFDNPVALTI